MKKYGAGDISGVENPPLGMVAFTEKDREGLAVESSRVDDEAEDVDAAGEQRS
jgi:hypothetical protein